MLIEFKMYYYYISGMYSRFRIVYTMHTNLKDSHVSSLFCIKSHRYEDFRRFLKTNNSGDSFLLPIIV